MTTALCPDSQPLEVTGLTRLPHRSNILNILLTRRGWALPKQNTNLIKIDTYQDKQDGHPSMSSDHPACLHLSSPQASGCVSPRSNEDLTHSWPSRAEGRGVETLYLLTSISKLQDLISTSIQPGQLQCSFSDLEVK